MEYHHGHKNRLVGISVRVRHNALKIKIKIKKIGDL
jgi:hypothetical protein